MTLYKNIVSCFSKKLFILIISSLLFACGSDDSQPKIENTPEQTTNPSVKITTSSVTITGIVTDSPIVNAEVKIFIGDKKFTTITDNKGIYSLLIEVDQKLLDKLVQLRAFGDEKINAGVEFVSQLGSVSSIIEQAGDDKTLDAKDNFSVNITNVTTAEFVLIKRENGGTTPTTNAELNTAKGLVNNEEKYALAALIKIVVDNDNYDLPVGTTSTLDLIEDETTADTFKAKVAANDSTLIEETVAEIRGDNTLTVESAIVGTWFNGDKAGEKEIIIFTRSGDFILMEYEKTGCQGLGYELGTYTWDKTTGQTQIHTIEEFFGCLGSRTPSAPSADRTDSDVMISVAGNTLTVDDPDDGDINYTRVIDQTNPIIGGFFSDDGPGEFFLSVHLANGHLVTLDYAGQNSGVSVGLFEFNADSKVLDYNSPIATQMGSNEPYQAVINIQGDILVGRDGNEVGVLKRISTTTTQSYLLATDVIGMFSVDENDGDYHSEVTLNSDGTGKAYNVDDGDTILQWEIIQGQLVLKSTPDDYIGVLSPTSITTDIMVFSSLDFIIDSTNEDTSFYMETWTRK